MATSLKGRHRMRLGMRTNIKHCVHPAHQCASSLGGAPELQVSGAGIWLFHYVGWVVKSLSMKKLSTNLYSSLLCSWVRLIRDHFSASVTLLVLLGWPFIPPAWSVTSDSILKRNIDRNCQGLLWLADSLSRENFRDWKILSQELVGKLLVWWVAESAWAHVTILELSNSDSLCRHYHNMKIVHHWDTFFSSSLIPLVLDNFVLNVEFGKSCLY